MDKIDEWMNRAFDGKVTPINSLPKPGAHPSTPRAPIHTKQQAPASGRPISPQAKNQQPRQFQQRGQQQPRPQQQQARTQSRPQARPMQQQPRVQFARQQVQPRQTQQSRSQQMHPQPSVHPSAPRVIQPKPVAQQKLLTHIEARHASLSSSRVNAPQTQIKQMKQFQNKQKNVHRAQNAPNTHNAPHAQQGQRPPSRALQSLKVKAKPEKKAPVLLGKLKIIPLGGLNEVGKNMMVYEYEEDIIVIDMGLEFPDEDMLGIDYVIPDVSYLEENRKRIKGIVITHGHLDHIGGIPYILPKLDFPPVYATRLTCGLIEKRVEEFKQEKLASIRVIDPDKPLRLGKFDLNFFRVAHSIPDSVGIVIDTPIGKIVHTGDFKFDDSPSGNQKKADIHKIKALGSQNVLALFSDSTNALKPGHTMSESEVGKTLEELIQKTKGRIIIASFSTLIGRLQQIIEYAQKYNRKIFVSGRSMRDNINIASKLGFLQFPKGIIQDIRKYQNKSADEQTLILTTGSQGEAISALSRIAANEHPHIKIKKGDTVVLSSSPIIGNEKAIFSVVNNLCLQGANVIHNQIMDVHTSGHGYQEELKQMIRMVNPKYFVPVHGEYFMRQTHGNLAKDECGIPESNVLMMQNGEILLAERGVVTKTTTTVDTKYILIDGLGEGHVGSQVQMDRQIMAQNGALIVLVHVNRKTGALKRTPDVVSRGFVYMHETDEVANEIANVAGEAYRTIRKKHHGATRQDVKQYIKQTVDKFTHSKLERRPLIVPLIIED